MAMPKKAYKLTYKFISELRNLLEGDNWIQHHQVRIDELSRSLEQTPEEMADARVASIRERGKKFDEKNYPKMLESFARIQETTRSEIDQLKANMEQGVYTIGVAPFYTAEDAQKMLEVAHILEVDTGAYNQDAISAIRNMLEANFSELCTAQVTGKMFVEYIGSKTLENDDIILDKVFKGETLTVSDLLHYPDDENSKTIKNMETIIENNEFIDKEELKKIAEEIRFIEKFYPLGEFSSALCSMVCTQYFNSAESFKSFFTNPVDFSTVETIEKSIPIDSVIRLSSIDPEELKIWREIIELNGPKALKTFIEVSNLGDTEVNVLAIAQEHGVENAFAIINAKFEEVSKFAREDENPEFAALCYKYDVPEEKFTQILDKVIPHQKTSDTLPDISFEFKLGKHTYSFEKLAPGSLEALLLGKMTNCCQFIGGEGEKYAIRGFVQPDTGFYVIRDAEGKIKAQSYAWSSSFNGTPTMVFDSFEFMPELEESFLPAIKKYQSILTEQTGLSLVVGSGGRTPKTDAEFLGSGVERKAPSVICPEFEGVDDAWGEDSSSTYVINQNTKLKVLDSLPVFNSYDELIHMNSRFTFARLAEQYTELNKQQKFEFSATSNVIYLLLEEQVIDTEGAIDLVTSVGRYIQMYRNHCYSAYEACKQKIAECKAQGITDPKEVVDYIFPVQSTMCVVETPEEVTLREIREAEQKERDEIWTKIQILQDEQGSIDISTNAIDISLNLARYREIHDEVSKLFKVLEASIDHTIEAADQQAPIDHDVMEAVCHDFIPDQAGVELTGGSPIEHTEAFAE